MAAQRYSRILQSARYYSQIDNYIKYITDASKRGSKVGTGTARPASQVLYLEPFGVLLGSGSQAQVSGAQSTWNERKSAFNGFVSDALPPDTSGVKIANFKAARVIITTGISSTGSVKTSAVTGGKYKSYGGKSTSIPFGSKTNFTSETNAFNQIKSALNLTAESTRVTLQPERI